MKKTTASPDHSMAIYPFKRICWSAIFVGAFVGLGLGFLLNLFGTMIGLSAFSADNAGIAVLAYGGIIGLFIGTIVSMFLAGYASGYLGRQYCPYRNLGIVYGFTTWTLALLLSSFLAKNLVEHVSTYAAGVVGPNVTLHVHDKTDSSSVTTDKNTLKVVASSQDLAISSAIIFILFFVGAASACWGACVGMSCKHED